jgi:polyisoprenoid-binding protein YceI
MSNTWKADPTHSEIGFKVKHMMFTNVSGKFDSYEVTVITEDNTFKNADVQFEAEISSLNTGNPDRDNHLRGEDFFNIESSPKLTFDGQITESSEGHQLLGELAMNGQSKQVIMPVDFGGVIKDPWGNDKAVFSINGKISRKDWGLTWNSALETGGVLVSDEVRVVIELQLVEAKQ